MYLTDHPGHRNLACKLRLSQQNWGVWSNWLCQKTLIFHTVLNHQLGDAVQLPEPIFSTSTILMGTLRAKPAESACHITKQSLPLQSEVEEQLT